MKKFYTLVKGIAIAVLLFAGYNSHSQFVLLDAGFGNNGKVVTPPPFSNKYGMQANEAVLQSDGKIVVAASSYYDLSVSDTSRFVLIRYNANGSLDNTFGTGGIVVTNINNKEDVATTLALQPDGKIIAAGYTTVVGFYNDWCMVRYKSTGTIDSSFGVNGIVTNSRSAYTEHIFSILIKPDGKILAAGDASNATRTEVVQFDSTGRVDSTFGLNGIAGVSPVMTIAKLTLQPDGKIVAAGYILNTDSMSIVRFLANGQPDSSFGTAGKAYTLFTYGKVNSMSLQPDGKMILVGRASDLANNNTQVALARFNANGFIDSTFGVNGKVFSLGGFDQGYRVMVRPDGKLLVAASKDKGFSYVPPVYGNFALLKYNSDGSLDSTFGRRGVVFTDFAGANDEAYWSIMQPDGKIILGGFTKQNGKNNIALVRYESAGLTNYNTIRASVFYDNNLNGTKEASEPYFSQANVTTIKPGVDTVTISTNGKFAVEVDTGSYTTSVYPYHPYFNVVPALHNTSNSNYFNLDSVAFAVQPIAGKRDLEIELFPLGVARPGFPVQYKIFFRNNGTDTIAYDTIQFIKSAKLNFNAAYPAPNSIHSDTLRWGFSNLKPLDTAGIMLYLTVKAPPVVNFGDTLKSVVWFDSSATTDITPRNDTSTLKQIARGAYDPNNKTESHGGKITLSQVQSGNYLLYTVNFQNTGTDTAFNVYIRDTLDSKLDWNSLEMLTASASYQMIMNDGKCLWTFSNINLVDSNHNKPASHGYLVYRIKPKSTVQIGDVLTNSASIYFDYNLPVLTNTDTTIVVSGALPLKLLSFIAKKDGKVNNLHWSTGNEVNVDRFEIERSGNGHEFSTIGRVESKTLNGGSNYDFTDERPETRNGNYYRLKMLDKDGSFTYSPVRLVSNNSSFSVSVHPNPVKDVLHIEVVSNKQATLQVQVVDNNGKVMLTSLWNVTEGNAMKTINTSSLQSGSYFIRVTLLPLQGTSRLEQCIVPFQKM